MRFIRCLPLLLLCFSCSSNESIDKKHHYASYTQQHKFKDVFFDVERNVNYTKLEVVHPLNIEEKEVYILHDSGFKQDDTIHATHFIELPIKKVACLSTSHLGYIEALGQQNTVKAALNTELIYSKQFQKNFNSGDLISLGGAKLNVETLINQDIQLVFASVFDAAGMKKVEQMRNLGIKVVLVSEFMEEKPLEKVKWIKFFANFYEKQSLNFADSIFSTISKSYNNSRKLVEEKKIRPKVITGLPWKGNWFVPSGNSFQTNFLTDAGAQYIFENDSNLQSKTVDFEIMLAQGIDVPYWIHVSDLNKFSELEELDKRYTAFKAYKEHNIYNNNARINSSGGNDYWESGVVNADVVLKDLIKIFHPDVLPEHSLYYYKKLE